MQNITNIPGLEIEIKSFDFQKVVQDELGLVARFRQEKYETVMEGLENVTAIEGRATFISKNEIQVDDRIFFGEKFLIAAGSTAAPPSIPGIKEVGYLTHIEALQLKKQPKELIVLGAGAAGLEFAQMYSRFGTKVTIFQRSSSIFRKGAEILTKEGITIKTNVSLKEAIIEKGKKVISYEINSKQENVSADEILVATGKIPNTEELGLEKAGVKINAKMAIMVNGNFQSSVPHIFAVGDTVALPLRQEPTAGSEGTLAAENALSGAKHTINYNTVPYTIFTDPQLAE